MIVSDSKHLLFIEPKSVGTPEPVVDEAVRRMVQAFRSGDPATPRYRGWHTCACGATSDNRNTNVWPVGYDYQLLTNSLCVHYLLWHRPEVPGEELQKVMLLPEVRGRYPLGVVLPGESQAPAMARGRWSRDSVIPL